MKNLLLLLPLALGMLNSCTTTYITPMAVSQPKRMDFAPDQSVPANQKTFVLPHDWQYGSWSMKKGCLITFNQDGTGFFNGTIYSQHANETPEEVHLQAVTYGADGNTLFTFPGSDVGFPIHVRRSQHDQIAEARFGFDQRYFAYIQDVKFFARARLNGLMMGQTANHQVSKVGW